MADVTLVKVLAQYNVIIELPDPNSEKREKAINALKEKGCTVFLPEARHFDIASDKETIRFAGLVVEPVQSWTKPTTTDWV